MEIPLTPRLQQIIERKRLSYTNREIAAELGISERTVKCHLRMLCLRLGIDGPAGGRMSRLLNFLDEPEINVEALKRLTETERRFVQPIVLGYSYEEIAQQRGCSVQTVKNTLAPIFDKLGISSRLELRNMLTI